MLCTAADEIHHRQDISSTVAGCLVGRGEPPPSPHWRRSHCGGKVFVDWRGTWYKVWGSLSPAFNPPPSVLPTGSLQWISLLCVCFAVTLRSGGRRAFTPGATSARVCETEWLCGCMEKHTFYLSPTYMCESTCDFNFQAPAPQDEQRPRRCSARINTLIVRIPPR